MRNLFSGLFFCMLAICQSNPTPNAPVPLTNKDVQEMHAAGLSSDVLIAKITASACQFDTSPASLGALKKSGIEDSVILAMVKSASGPEALKNVAPAAETSNSRAILHFYRERAYVGSLRTIPIYIDEMKMADLVNGRQFSMSMEPGKHMFRSRTKPEAIQITLEAGKHYYLRAELIQGFTKNHWHIVEMGQQQGEIDIQKLKPLDPGNVMPVARTKQ